MPNTAIPFSRYVRAGRVMLHVFDSAASPDDEFLLSITADGCATQAHIPHEAIPDLIAALAACRIAREAAQARPAALVGAFPDLAHAAQGLADMSVQR